MISSALDIQYSTISIYVNRFNEFFSTLPRATGRSQMQSRTGTANLAGQNWGKIGAEPGTALAAVGRCHHTKTHAFKGLERTMTVLYTARNRGRRVQIPAPPPFFLFVTSCFFSSSAFFASRGARLDAAVVPNNINPQLHTLENLAGCVRRRHVSPQIIQD